MSSPKKRFIPPQPKGVLYRVTASGATWGVLADKGILVDADPMGHWALGRQLDEYLQWVVATLGGTAKPVGEKHYIHRRLTGDPLRNVGLPVLTQDEDEQAEEP